jgi:hypothetical protein
MAKEKRHMPARCVQKTTSDQRLDAYWATVSDLVSLIDRTRGHQLIKEAAEAAVPLDGNVVVLDDLAADQASEASLLSDCNLRLREALHFLLEARASRKQRPAATTGRVAAAGAEFPELVAQGA